MSSGADCAFTEVAPGKWKYWLQDWPYGETESGQTYGPFSSFSLARKHLDDNHQNPGGYGVKCLESGHVHEWEEGEQHVPVGVTVSVTVHSLGPDPDRATLLALVRGLTDQSPSFRITPAYGYKRTTACASCGQVR